MAMRIASAICQLLYAQISFTLYRAYVPSQQPGMLQAVLLPSPATTCDNLLYVWLREETECSKVLPSWPGLASDLTLAALVSHLVENTSLVFYSATL